MATPQHKVRRRLDSITKEPLGMVHQLPDMNFPCFAALVYQMGYAFVFQVEKTTDKDQEPISRLPKNRGTTRLLLKASFLEAFRFAQGLAAAGWVVETFTVDFVPTDVAAASWSRKLEENVWYPMIEHRILWPGSVNAESKEEKLARFQRHMELELQRKKKR